MSGGLRGLAVSASTGQAAGAERRRARARARRTSPSRSCARPSPFRRPQGGQAAAYSATPFVFFVPFVVNRPFVAGRRRDG